MALFCYSCILKVKINDQQVASLDTGEIGDSGYLSQATADTHTVTPQHGPHSPPALPSPIDIMPRQALLLPHSPATGKGCLAIR